MNTLLLENTEGHGQSEVDHLSLIAYPDVFQSPYIIIFIYYRFKEVL